MEMVPQFWERLSTIAMAEYKSSAGRYVPVVAALYLVLAVFPFVVSAGTKAEVKGPQSLHDKGPGIRLELEKKDLLTREEALDCGNAMLAVALSTIHSSTKDQPDALDKRVHVATVLYTILRAPDWFLLDKYSTKHSKYMGDVCYADPEKWDKSPWLEASYAEAMTEAKAFEQKGQDALVDELNLQKEDALKAFEGAAERSGVNQASWEIVVESSREEASKLNKLSEKDKRWKRGVNWNMFALSLGQVALGSTLMGAGAYVVFGVGIAFSAGVNSWGMLTVGTVIVGAGMALSVGTGAMSAFSGVSNAKFEYKQIAREKREQQQRRY